MQASKREKARAGLESLFKDSSMARRLDVPPYVTTALHQWGGWANRPQLWVNLNITPFYKLVGIGHGRSLPEIKLDPQSMRIHKSFLKIKCDSTKMVLAGYYVANENWDSKEQVYRQYRISRRKFYETLKTGSIALYNSANIK